MRKRKGMSAKKNETKRSAVARCIKRVVRVIRMILFVPPMVISGYVMVLFAILCVGYSEAKEWAEECNIPMP